MEEELRRLPEGTWHAAMTIDGYDEPLALRCALKIEDGKLHLDFSGSADASGFGINVPLAYTAAYATFAVRCVIGNDVPNNAGSLSTLRVEAPAGSILNASAPSAVSARHSVGQMLPDLVLECLAQILPEAVPAQGASCIWNPVFLGRDFVINPIYNGGTGARTGQDGLSTTAFPSGVRTTSTEVNELTSDLVVWRREFRPDSGGAGRYRGGLGQEVIIGSRRGEPFEVSKMFDRVHHAAQGRNGGQHGAAGEVLLSSGRLLNGKGKEVVPAGDRLILRTPGGGGIGEPEQRSKAALELDRTNGYTS